MIMTTLLADEAIAFIFGIIEVFETSSGVDFKVQVLMTVGALVADVVAHQKILFCFHYKSLI